MIKEKTFRKMTKKGMKKVFKKFIVKKMRNEIF